MQLQKKLREGGQSMFPSWTSLDELKEWHDWADGVGHWWPIGFGAAVFLFVAVWTTYNRMVDKQIDFLQATEDQRVRDETEADKAAMLASIEQVKLANPQTAQLLERLILAQEESNRVTQDAAYYAQVITPLRTQFEEVHQDYMNSFKNYDELLRNPDYPKDANHPVFAKLESDRKFTQWRRDALKSVKDDSGKLTPLIAAIKAYLTLGSDTPGEFSDDSGNPIRSTFDKRVRHALIEKPTRTKASFSLM
jgi:hypothetical protein